MPIREEVGLMLSTHNARFNIQELHFAYYVWCYSHNRHLFSFNSFKHFVLALQTRVCYDENF